ncbi:MAG: GNAT family N-acetyltransferase [Candidatus Delongbacteria bacterium]|jgi:ribosomal-protein-alanine N-acetyltransferase|nr:GNAT family N-acetyltransferase [Candidatus Delongbacteria bacterium]
MENKLEVFTPNDRPNKEEKEKIVQFLFEQLQEYGDPIQDIEKAIGYAMKDYESFGGMILVSFIDDLISGVVVLNKTGMKDYIPENILVYIATHKDMRGKGIGKFLMKKSIELTDGNIALHVEPENPARFLYEKVGFTSKYIEMRHKK